MLYSLFTLFSQLSIPPDPRRYPANRPDSFLFLSRALSKTTSREGWLSFSSNQHLVQTLPSCTFLPSTTPPPATSTQQERKTDQRAAGGGEKAARLRRGRWEAAEGMREQGRVDRRVVERRRVKGTCRGSAGTEHSRRSEGWIADLCLSLSSSFTRSPSLSISHLLQNGPRFSSSRRSPGHRGGHLPPSPGSGSHWVSFAPLSTAELS